MSADPEADPDSRPGLARPGLARPGLARPGLGAKLLLVTLSALLALALVELVLALAGFPSSPPAQVTHPPHYREQRENLEFRYTFETNDQGLRSPEIPLDKPEERYRLLVVGDSIVEGMGVEMEEAFPARLERQLEDRPGGLDVLNGGLSGTGPATHRELVRTVAPRYDVDGVLLCLFANDLWDMGRLPPSPPELGGALGVLQLVLPRIATRLAGLSASPAPPAPGPVAGPRRFDLEASVSREAERRGLPAARIEAWRRALPPALLAAANEDRFAPQILAFGLLHPDFWRQSLDLDSEEALAKWAELERVLVGTVKENRAAGRGVALVYLPVVFQIDQASHEATRPWPRMGTELRRAWLEGESELQRRLRELARELELPYLDLTPELRRRVAAGQRLNFELDEHLDGTGHAAVAEEIGAWIVEEEVFPGLVR